MAMEIQSVRSNFPEVNEFLLVVYWSHDVVTSPLNTLATFFVLIHVSNDLFSDIAWLPWLFAFRKNSNAYVIFTSTVCAFGSIISLSATDSLTKFGTPIQTTTATAVRYLGHSCLQDINTATKSHDWSRDFRHSDIWQRIFILPQTIAAKLMVAYTKPSPGFKENNHP